MKPRLFVLFLIFIYSVLSAYAGNFLPLRLVKGDSMEPMLHTGDVILLKSAPFSDIARGDVIAYRIPPAAVDSAEGKPVTILHRVMRAEVRDGERVLLTKGDNSVMDPWPVTSSLVQGKLGFRLPWIGRPILFLASSRVALFISLAPVTLLLYVAVMRAARPAFFRQALDNLPLINASMKTPLRVRDG